MVFQNFLEDPQISKPSNVFLLLPFTECKDLKLLKYNTLPWRLLELFAESCVGCGEKRH